MQLYGLHMKNGTRIQERLHCLDKLSDYLSAIGEVVSDVHKVAVLFQSVQDSYSTLVTALFARGGNELTLVFVKQALLDEEQRRGRISDLGSGDTALRSGCRFGTKKWKTGTSTYFKGDPDSDSESNEMFVAMVELKINTQSDEWIIDSGASQHMTFQTSVLCDYKKFVTPEPVGL